MKKDISLWGNKIHVNHIRSVLHGFTLHDNSPKVISELKAVGFQVLLISAGIDILVQKVADELSISHHLANGLETDDGGHLTGNGIFRVDLLRKDIAFENKLNELKVKADDCIAVGDSRYDVEFLKKAGMGIAVGKDPELKRYANHQVSDLEDILKIILKK